MPCQGEKGEEGGGVLNRICTMPAVPNCPNLSCVSSMVREDCGFGFALIIRMHVQPRLVFGFSGLIWPSFSRRQRAQHHPWFWLPGSTTNVMQCCLQGLGCQEPFLNDGFGRAAREWSAFVPFMLSSARGPPSERSCGQDSANAAAAVAPDRRMVQLPARALEYAPLVLAHCNSIFPIMEMGTPRGARRRGWQRGRGATDRIADPYIHL